MGFVTWMVQTADEALDAAAESSFGALAGAMGSMIMLASTLLIILVLVSFAFQTRSMDGRTAVLLLARLLLINAFALNWVQFNAVSSAIIDGLDQLGGAMIEALGGTGPEGAIGFAEAFDEVLATFGDYLNAATTEMGWMAGAMITALGTAIMGIVGALAGGVLIFSKIMLTLMIGLAPVMIAASIFEATKDYFHRWLSALVGYAMYPLIIAGVMSTIVSMARSMMESLGDPNDADSIGALLPFFAMVFMAAGMIAAIPLIVKALSGNVVMPHAPSAVGAVQSMITRYTAGQRRSHERERERREQARWQEEDRLRTQAQRAGSGAGSGSGDSGQTVVNYQEIMARNRRLDAAGITGPSSLQPKPTVKPTS
ncbi:type IV secretion system protein [Rubellimicrobium roseum]|uniref:Type IV secretion system protein n=1 Tax=Rubellimicrobium roseum TaxID=687525 RepID=A0A5C4N6D1_9RHOB|nr:type IV secretion system protein [Rubellimicrobium roseum]TNC66270.1 type IV secretion system protein [Rubellimicrobium roseum]